MIKTLKVSSARINWITALFLFTLAISIVSVYFLIYYEEFAYIIVIGFSSFLIPWSHSELIEMNELKKRQFQKLVIEEDHFLFENLPQRGGVKISLLVDYSNIKNIEIHKTYLSVEVVRRQNWNGVSQEIFMPMGSVPKVQRFSLPANHRQSAEILNFLASKELQINYKTKRFV